MYCKVGGLGKDDWSGHRHNKHHKQHHVDKYTKSLVIIFKRVCPANMLANNRIDKLKGRIQ